MPRQKQLRQWSDDYEPRTTGIDISRMAHAALGIEPPLFPNSFDEVVRERVFRTTEYAIRRTAPNTPDRPEDGTAYHPLFDDRRGERESETVQTNLAVATDGGTTENGEREGDHDE